MYSGFFFTSFEVVVFCLCYEMCSASFLFGLEMTDADFEGKSSSWDLLVWVFSRETGDKKLAILE